MDENGALSREELELAKRYMRVDGTEDDLMVGQCVAAARGYMAQAGVSLPAERTPRRACYDLVCHALALDLYDRREMSAETATAESKVLRAMLNQLKLTEPEPETETTTEEA